MSFVMKHMSKKTLSVILALMILVSAVSVAFSAIANAAAVPYVVTMGKPAIAMLSGYTIDLDKINVEFGIEEVPGDEITWAVTPNASIIFDAEKSTISVLKPGSYSITATKTSEPEKVREIALSATEEKSTEVPLYQKNFTAADVADGDFTTASGWKLIKTAGTSALTFDATNGAIINATNTSAYYVLDPLSDAAKLLKNFADLSIEMELGNNLNNAATGSHWFGPVARLTYANNTVSTTPATKIFAKFKYTSSRIAATATNLDVSGSLGSDTAFSGVKIPTGVSRYKMVLSGANATVYSQIKDVDTAYVNRTPALNSAQTDALAATVGNGGTIGFYRDKAARVGLVSVRAWIDFTETELERIAKACTENPYYLVNSAKPAIPVLSGKTLNLNAMLVEFSNGEILFGSEIDWSIPTGSAMIFDSTNNYLSVFKAGNYEITATKKNAADVTLKIHIFVSDVPTNSFEIYNHTFTAADLTAEGAFVADSEWAVTNSSYSNPRKLVYAANGSLQMHMDTGTGYWLGDLTDGTYYLKPESDSAKLLSKFAEVSVEATVIPTTAWANGSVTTGYFGPIARRSADGASYVGSYYTPSNSRISRHIVTVSGSSNDVTSFTDLVTVNTENTIKLSVYGNTVNSYYNGVLTEGKNLTATQTQNLKNTKGGSIAFRVEPCTRIGLKAIKVSALFDNKELKKAETLYADVYKTVSSNNPILPMRANTKISLDNLVFEMSDGTFLLGKDVTWENNNGAIKVDAADNSISLYTEGFFTIKAKKDAADAGREIYVITPDSEGKYKLYEHTFTADDLDANGAFKPESEWKAWINSSDNKWGYTNDGIAPLLWNGTTHWLGDLQYGTIYLDKNSASGKIVSSFADVTVVAKIKPTVRFNVSSSYVGIMARLDLGSDNEWQSTDSTVMATYTIPGGLQGNDLTKYHTTVNLYINGKALQKGLLQEFPLTEKVVNTITLKTLGSKVETKVNNGTLYQKIEGVTLTEAQQAALDSTVGKAGKTVGIHFSSTTRAVATGIEVYTEFEPTELAKYKVVDIAPLYTVYQSYPAIPMKQATKLDLSKLLIQLPDGNYAVGNDLKWSTDYVGSAFLVDDTNKEIYAYNSGRYDVVIKDAEGNKVLDVHFVVADDNGEYKLFDYTFTKSDAEEIAKDGTSDMWIASVHMMTNGKDSGLPQINNIMYMANSWRNNVTPMALGGSLQYDENKGISMYTNEWNLLTLNPEHYEAKIISKFSDYAINLTASSRDKDITGKSNWTQRGEIGILGRVDFGADGILSFTNGSYMPNRAVSYEHNRLTIMEGTVANLSQINNLAFPGNEYTWSALNGAENVTIDNEAGTIVASKYGIYNIKGTKDGAADVTISVIVPHENYLDHMVGGIFKVSETPSLTVLTYKGDNGGTNKYTGKNTFDIPVTNSSFKYSIPDTYNFKLTLKGNDIAYYVAPNGTVNYAELYNSTTTPLTAAQKTYMDASNKKTGTISLYSNGMSRAFFKSVSVSLDIKPMPDEYLIGLGECRDENNRIVYLEVGETLDLTQVNFEAGNRYHNGASITFTNVPTGLTVVNGVSITPTKVGDYTLTGKGADGTTITITVAVSEAGKIYNNGNYKFDYKDGLIIGYGRADETKPYSEYVKFPSEHANGHVYELGGALAMGNLNNKQLVEVEIEKYIEKIGSGAFIDAVKLQKVTIPNTVESIGGSAFAGAPLLKDVFLPASVSEIGDSAFRGDTSLVVTIANKDAVIGENAFSVGATIKGYAGSTAEAYANANGITFVALTGEDKAKADASVAEFEQIIHDRYNKVNTSVEWVISEGISRGFPTYSIVGFKYTDRSAGKFVIPRQLEVQTLTEGKKVVNINPGSAAMADCVDSRAVYSVELEEGVGHIGFWAFRGCYNLRDVKLPSTLTGIAQQTFSGCSALQKIDIPDKVVTLGLYAFENCDSLTEVNISPDSMLQAIGTNAVRKTEIPGRFLYGTQVEKFVFPVSIDWITNSMVTDLYAPRLNEVWIYNKDCLFTIETDAWQFYFNKGTVIHGVPGSTAEALVKADEALKNSTDPEEKKRYRDLKFVGDIKDFYVENEGVYHEGGTWSGIYDAYDEDPNKEGAWVEKESPYYAISTYSGKGGKVIMPAYLDINGQKNVPIYAVSNQGFQFETIPTGGLPKIINLEISEGIAVIEDEAFSGAIHMKSVKLPTSLIKIGAKAFVNTALEGKLEIPKNVASIGNAAFRSIPNLTDIVILNPNLVFGGGVFDNTITIHGIKGSTAEAYATKNKINFVEIEAPAQSTVADFTDNGNYKFTVKDGYITGYERVNASKEYSQKITVPAKINGVAIKGVAAGAFDKGAEATSIMAVELQEGITEIPKEAFKGLIKLVRINFPKSLKSIGEAAFENTMLNGEITLPEGLERIERNAFKNLSNITAITILSRTVVIDPAGLPRVNKNMIVYGYTGSTAEAWAKSVKWKNFEYLDGGPVEEPEEDKDFTEEPEDTYEDEGGEDIIRIIRKSNLGLVIVIAVSLLLFTILIAMVAVVLVVIKKKRDEEMGL